MTEVPAHKVRGVGNDIYGQARLALALLVRNALETAGVTWCLDAGTLLGAHRDGKLIAHDDDVDIAVYYPVFDGERQLRELQQQVELPEPYDTRIVRSYAQKVEVFDRSSKRFTLPPVYHGADFHTVTVDLQAVTDAPDGGVVYLHDMLGHVRLSADMITPTGLIACEGERFNCPHDPVRFLTAHYGYLGSDARYDPATKKYVKA